VPKPDDSVCFCGVIVIQTGAWHLYFFANAGRWQVSFAIVVDFEDNSTNFFTPYFLPGDI